MFLSHIDVSLSLPLFLPLSLKAMEMNVLRWGLKKKKNILEILFHNRISNKTQSILKLG